MDCGAFKMDFYNKAYENQFQEGFQPLCICFNSHRFKYGIIKKMLKLKPKKIQQCKYKNMCWIVLIKNK